MRASRPTLRSRLERSGIRRAGGPRNGFRYRCASGGAISAADRERVARLGIPPAWRDVVIAPRAGERLQAIGRDGAGRWQYLYRRDHTERRARIKFDRLAGFGRALPALRSALRADLAPRDMPLARACAGALLLLTAAALRPGHQRYARENGTFGLATLRPRHVSVRGAVVRLSFRGKHGVWQQQVLRSARLAGLVREMLRLPGRELFKYRDRRGHLRDLRVEHLNAYIQRAMGERFTARDFRTWCATLLCAGALRELRLAVRDAARAEPGASARSAEVARDALVRRALSTTARWLGNTPAVTRESYVHPKVLQWFLEGRVVAHALARPERLAERVPRALHPAERALLRLLAGA